MSYFQYTSPRVDEKFTFIPSHWEKRKLKFSVKLRNEKIEAQKSELEYLGLENIESWTGKKTNTTTVSREGAANIFYKNDVLFGKLRPYLAKVYLTQNKGVVSTEALVLNSEQLSPKFLSYALLTDWFIESVNGTTYGSKMPRANWEDIGKIEMLIPPKEEQEKIANFLDWKTGQIDKLIEKKEQLIKKLDEQRTAIITQAVTKGLNPGAPMKDSGIPWLGEVPEHWDVQHFRRFTDLQQGLQIPQSERLDQPEENCVEYITVKSIHAGNNGYKEYIKAPSNRTVCQKDDILLARTGATGEVFTNLEGAFHNNFFRVNYSNKVSKEFLVALLKCKQLKEELILMAGTTTIPDLNHGAFLSTGVAIPSIKEQLDIVFHIKHACQRPSNIITQCKKTIQLLSEYRTALITAATTGKIDVRDIEIPTVAKAATVQQS